MNEPVVADPWSGLRQFTRARIALGRTGDSLPTTALLEFGVAHAAARDAVHARFASADLEAELAGLGFGTLCVKSRAPDRATYLRRPDLGRSVASESVALLDVSRPPVAPTLLFVVADGLSAIAPMRHAVPVLEAIVARLPGVTIGPVVVAEQARVAMGDEVGALLGAHFVAVLIGERPGLSSPDSLGIYLTSEPRPGRSDAERNCISNIRPEGLGYVPAAEKFAWLLNAARELGGTGVALKDESDALPALSHAPARLDDPRLVSR